MKEVITTYRKEAESEYGILKIPPILANALDWEDYENIRIKIKTENGETGLFVYRSKHRIRT